MGSTAFYWQLLGVGGVLGAARGKLAGHPIEFRVHRSDLPHDLFLRVPSSDVRVYSQIFIRGEYDVEVSRPPDTIVDAGANIGLVSIYLASRFPAARILALEPERGNFALLCKNVERYPNVVPVYGALWDENAEVDLIDPGIGPWGFRTRRRGDFGTARRLDRVPGFTLDRLMRDYGLDHLDLLKMDIEGAEVEVLRDSAGWIDRVDAIVLELHEWARDGCDQSFRDATGGFPQRWQRGEGTFAARAGASIVAPRSATTTH